MKTILGWIQTTLLILLVTVMTVQESLAQGAAIDETRQVTPNERIRLNVMRGEVNIRTTTNAVFSVRGTLDEEAEGYELESDGGLTEFRVVMPNRLGFSMRIRSGSDLEITVPVNSDIEFTGVNVNVDVEGVLGGSRINTVNGEIRASDLARFVELRTVNGAITSLDNRDRVDINTVNGDIEERNSTGRLSIQSVNGELRLDSTADIADLTVVNGSIEGQLRRVQELEIESVNGQITLALPDASAPRVNGSTVNGAIRLTFDSNVDARFSVRNAVGGRIVNELTDDEASRPRTGPGLRLDFTTASGAGTVNLTSVSGRLELRRR